MAVLPQTSPRRQASAEEPVKGTSLAASTSIPAAVPVRQPVGWVSASDSTLSLRHEFEICSN